MSADSVIAIAAGVASGALSGAVAARYRAKAEVEVAKKKIDARERREKIGRDTATKAQEDESIQALQSAAQGLIDAHAKGNALAKNGARRKLANAARNVAPDSAAKPFADELAGMVQDDNPDAIRRALDRMAPVSS